MPFCSQCGTQVRDAARFCRNCGTQLGEGQAQASSQPEPTTPSIPPPPPFRPDQNPAQPVTQRQSFIQRPVVKWGGIGCGGIVGLFVVIGIIGAFAGLEDESDPISSLRYCDHPDSLKFLQAQNELVNRNNERIEALQVDFFTLMMNPLAARDDGWYRNVLADVDRLDADGKSLAGARPVPAPAADLNRQFQDVGRQMSRVASIMSKTVNDARVEPWPISKWEPVAEEFEDATDNLHDKLDDVVDEIQEECG